MTQDRVEFMELLLSEELGDAWDVRIYNQLGSTMDIAREMLPLAQDKSGLVIALKQLSGRGRQGKIWRAAGEGLYVTFVWRSPSDISRMSGFSLVVGSVLREVFATLGAAVKLKWPNDVLDLDGRKLSGTLIELIALGGEHFTLCGIGVNLRDAPGDISEAVSLFELCGKTFSPLELARRIGPALTQAFQTFQVDGFMPFEKNWNDHAYGLGNVCKFECGERTVVGDLVGVDSLGRIVIQSNGEAEAFAVGQLAK